MDTQTQIDRLIELAIIQRSELKQLVEQLPQLREHLNAEVEKVFDETEPQLRAELEEWTTKQTADKTAALGVALEAKIADLAKSLEVSTQARYNAIIAEREQNARLAAEAEAKIAEHAASLPSAVKDIVTAELARFPRAGEIDQLRKEFAEPKSLNPRGKWQAGETYNKLDLVTINGDSYTSNTDDNRTRPSRSSAEWTLVAARGTGGGGGPTSLSELTTVPSDGDLLIGSGTSWVTSNLTAGAGISITVGPGAITISATDGDITLDDGTAASPSLHFTNDPDTGIYRPAANTLGISVSGTQIAYFDENGLTVPSAGVVAGGSFHGANGNANNPSFSFTSDQDTGFYRHGTNELGISIGGTEKAVMTSTTFSITPNVSTSGNLTVSGTGTSSFAGTLLQRSSTGVGAIASIGTDTGSYSVLRVQNTGASGRSFDIGTAGSGDATLGSKLYIYDSTAGATRWTMDSSGNIAQTGNLTVSGTGQSSVSGYLSINSALAGSTYGRLISGTTTAGLPAFFATNAVNASLVIDFPSSFVARIKTNSASEVLAFGIGATERARFETTGNLLLGTTIDGGQKLQVAGDAAFAGNVTVDKATPTILIKRGANTQDGVIAFATGGNGDFSVGNRGTSDSDLHIYNYGLAADAVTISKNTSNATFAGTVNVAKGAPQVKVSLDRNSSTDSAYLRYTTNNTQNWVVGTGTTGSDTNYSVYSYGGGGTALSLNYTTGDATFAGKITANGAGSTFKGTATNDSAAAGYVGELISGNDGGGVALTTGTRTNIASISLTAGDWDVTGYVGYLPSGGAASTYQEGSISATSATLGAAGARTIIYTSTTAQIEVPLPTVRVSLASTTTYYLVSLNTFTGGTMSGTGIIRARRVR